MSGGRGPSWRRSEILDLLAIWGENRVQSSLRESHRNKDIFEDVAAKMVERGHQRNGEECRAKSKSMRLAYKRVLSHNNKSGNNRATCPFFEELDRILKGDPTVKTRRLSQSLERRKPEREKILPAIPENLTIDLYTINPEEIADMDGVYDQHIGNTDCDVEKGSVTDDSYGDETGDMALEDVDHPEREETDNIVSDSSEGQRSMTRKEIPPGVALSDLSPNSRLDLQRARRKRVSAIQRVGEMMLRQSFREHQTMIASNRSENDRFLEEMRTARLEEKKGTETMCALFKEAIHAMRDMPRAISEYRLYREREVEVVYGMGMDGGEERPSASGMTAPGFTSPSARDGSVSKGGRETERDAMRSEWLDCQAGRKSFNKGFDNNMGDGEDRGSSAGPDFTVIQSEKQVRGKKGHSVFMDVAMRAEQEKEPPVRAKRVVKPKKPFSPCA